MQDIDASILEIVATQLRINLDHVKRESHLANDLQADSLDTVELIMALEQRFALRLVTREVRVETVQDVIDYIKHLLAERDASSSEVAAEA